MTRITIYAMAAFVSILSVACHKEAVISNGESDTATDLDTDTDSDTDVDTDSDNDADTDTDTDSDIDTDTDTGPVECVTPITFTEHYVDDLFEGAFSVHAADLDGDSDLDLLGGAPEADDIAWWENATGDGSVWTKHTIDDFFGGAISVHAADLDGDSDLDALGAANQANSITWWENAAGDGSVWTEHTIDDFFDYARSVYATDLDGDSDSDVLGAAYGADSIAWWENTTGDGSVWTEHTIDDFFDGPHSVHAADLDGDSDMDVLGAAVMGDDISWWENTAGDGSSWAEHTLDDFFDGATSVYAADLDGDSDMDVLGAAIEASTIAWWENTVGDGSSWAQHTINSTFWEVSTVHAADLDGDSDLDVLGDAMDIVGLTKWYENTTGSGLVWAEHILDAFVEGGSNSVNAADLDGDSDLDMLGAASYSNVVRWFENSCVP